jgi:dTDP-4-amino-4,6-dideoxygalactose transaminase
VVRSKRRNELAAHLDAAGIATGIHYPVPCHLQEPCRTYGLGPGSLPETERAAHEILSLPVYPELTDEQVSRIINEVRAFAEWGATVRAAA